MPPRVDLTGAVDLHCHFAPDAHRERSVDAFEAARDAAVAASLLLQHGCPVETLRRALTRNADSSASGPLARALDLFALP